MKRLPFILLLVVVIAAIALKWSGIIENKEAIKEIEASTDALQNANNLEVASNDSSSQISLDNPKGIQFKTAVQTIKISGENIGLSPEGGGIGPGGIVFDESGQLIIFDRLRDRITSVKEDGSVEVLHQIDSNDLLKGAEVNEAGDLLVLTGSEKLKLVKIDKEGNKKIVAEGVDTDIMNGYLVHEKANSTYLIGLTQTMVLEEGKEARKMYGAPSFDGKESFDIELDEQGTPVMTFRDNSGAPLKTEKEQGHYGNVRQLQPYKNGFLVVFESDPNESEFHFKNPFYTVQLRDANGRIINEMNVAKKGSHSVDFPIAVKSDGTVVQVVAEENEVTMESYQF